MSEKIEKPNIRNGALRVITAADFTNEVLAPKQPVLVEFWTSWSRPCQILDSVLRELAGAWGKRVKVFKVDADSSLDLSLCYNVQSVPTLLYFVHGKLCERIVGTASKDAILAKLKPLSE